jgi:hypothetical protein
LGATGASSRGPPSDPDGDIAVSEISLLAALEEGRRPLVPCSARWKVERVQVLAVLERTAVVHPAELAGEPPERVLARLGEVTVDPESVIWRPVETKPRWGGRLRRGVRRCYGCGRSAPEVSFPAQNSWLCGDCRRARHRRDVRRGPERRRGRQRQNRSAA